MGNSQGRLELVCSFSDRAVSLDIDVSTHTAYVLTSYIPFDAAANPQGGLGERTLVSVNLTGEPVPTTVYEYDDYYVFGLAVDGQGSSFSYASQDDSLVKTTFATKKVTKVECPAELPYSVAMSPAMDALFSVHQKNGTLTKLSPTGETLLDTYPEIGPAENYYANLRVDDSYAYVVKDEAEIWSVDLRARTVSRIPWTQNTNVFAVCPFGTDSLYVTDTRALWAKDLRTGAETKLVELPSHAYGTGLALDGTDLYLADYDRSLYRVRFDAPLAPPVISAPQEGATVTDPRQTVSGTVTNGVDKVTVADQGTPLGDVVPSSGTWSFSPTRDWAPGDHTVQAVAHKGEEVSEPATRHFTVSPLSPLAPPVFAVPGEGAVTADPRQIIAGTVTAEVDTVVLTDGGTPLTEIVPADEGWSFTPSSDWAAGEHTLGAVAHSGSRTSQPAIRHFTVTGTPEPVTTISSVGGDHFSAPKGTVFADLLTVIARNTAGSTVADASLHFTIQDTGNTGSAFPGGASHCDPRTGPDGKATALPLTAGPRPGDFEVRVTAQSGPGLCTFTMTVTPS
ncbi:hypothetical protein [Streptomyces sp. BE147]|uniref:hypothetical protein n=1 Tax=Streptomyces sp. BE147 TaxID=3002524 RepID=UPI002E777016|nr:hypothetical protein [Streptomyces sp. BE147]